MRRLLIALTALLLLAGGMLLMARSRGEPWTTDSKEALAEFEKGLEARQKLYMPEALSHFTKAAELDPDFAVAKLMVAAFQEDEEARKRILAELREVDLDRLSAREAFMLRYHLAADAGEFDRAAAVIDEFIAAHPGDPFALMYKGGQAWEHQDLEEAEAYFRKLIETHPNWALAQNLLGYIAMARGDFEESEELFDTYKYIAPDQPNPHDSLGELLTVVGRYDEARRELEEALEIKPDFCASYSHLIDVALVGGSDEETAPILERIEKHCDEKTLAQQRCRVEIWRAFFSREFETAWQAGEAGCSDQLGDVSVLLHHAAVLTGREEEALAAEQRVKERIEKVQQRHGYDVKYLQGALLHMEGFRLLAGGEAAEAARRFELADRALLFWGSGQGLFKLYNRVNLAVAQRALGDEEAAQVTLAKVGVVNPEFPETYSKTASCLQQTVR